MLKDVPGATAIAASSRAALAAFGVMILAGTMPVGGASAAVVCDDGYQRTRNGWVATPYCEDANLGAVARKYGSRVSDAAIRSNPNLKYELCRFIGHDNRVSGSCPGDSSSRGQR